MTPLRSGVGWLGSLVGVAAMVGHLALGVLAVIEVARLPWLVSQPYEVTAVTVVAVSAALAVGGAARAAWPAARAGRALRRRLRSAARPLPGPIQSAAEPLGIAGRIDVVGVGEAFAVTYGLVHPRIVLSTGLIEVLDRPELVAVLVHERHHLRQRDPLRLLAARILAGYGWFLPVLRWRAARLALRRELAADRAATASTGVVAVAGALLKLADRPTPASMAAINPTGGLPERVAQLEGRPMASRIRLGWWLAVASAANLGGLCAAAICCAGLGMATAGGMA